MIIYGFTHIDAGWSSLVARWAHNPKAGGSNPPPATKCHCFGYSLAFRLVDSQ